MACISAFNKSGVEVEVEVEVDGERSEVWGKMLFLLLDVIVIAAVGFGALGWCHRNA